MKIILIISLVIGIYLFLDFSGIGYSFNDSLNKLVAGTPNKKCDVDSDCAVKKVYCGAGNCGEAMNKNWNSFCPFNEGIFYMKRVFVDYKPCGAEGRDFDVKCVDSQCKQVFKSSG